MGKIFQSPEVKDFWMCSFSSGDFLNAIEWCRYYHNHPNIIPKELDNDNCYDRLSVIDKTRLVVYNIFQNLSLQRDYSPTDIGFFNSERIKEIKILYPFVHQLCSLDIGVMTMPLCNHGGRPHNAVAKKMRATNFYDNEFLDGFELDIGWFMNEIRLGRKILIYYPMLTPTIYDPYSYAPRKGIILRYAMYCPINNINHPVVVHEPIACDPITGNINLRYPNNLEIQQEY